MKKILTFILPALALTLTSCPGPTSSDVSSVNSSTSISSEPTKDWTEEERDLFSTHLGGFVPTYYEVPGAEVNYHQDYNCVSYETTSRTVSSGYIDEFRKSLIIDGFTVTSQDANYLYYTLTSYVNALTSIEVNVYGVNQTGNLVSSGLCYFVADFYYIHYDRFENDRVNYYADFLSLGEITSLPTPSHAYDEYGYFDYIFNMNTFVIGLGYGYDGSKEYNDSLSALGWETSSSTEDNITTYLAISPKEYLHIFTYYENEVTYIIMQPMTIVGATWPSETLNLALTFFEFDVTSEDIPQGSGDDFTLFYSLYPYMGALVIQISATDETVVTNYTASLLENNFIYSDELGMYVNDSLTFGIGVDDLIASDGAYVIYLFNLSALLG